MAWWSRPLLDRLFEKFTVGDECWIWHAGVGSDGYGQIFTEYRDGKRKSAKGHRLVYEMLVGPIPEGMELDHLCRNRRCVNPDHLEPVTHAENVRRGDAGLHHAIKTHCLNGHPYDESNTYVRKDRVNRRECRICRAASARRSNKEKSLGLVR